MCQNPNGGVESYSNNYMTQQHMSYAQPQQQYQQTSTGYSE